jgi:hypothetical protein
MGTDVSVGIGTTVLVSVGNKVSTTKFVGILAIDVMVTSAVGVEGSKIPIDTLHRQQKIKRPEQPKSIFPIVLCFLKVLDSHEKNCRIAFMFQSP